MNKPQALNALDLPMVRGLTRVVHHTLLVSPELRVAIFEGAGGKAFCAGGDVRSLYDSGTAAGRSACPTEEQIAFFTEEYSLDHSLQQLPTNGIQQVAVYDGFVMGGGVGISIHAPFRIATEFAAFAMPETAIGLFPDVGGSYFLPKLPHQVGMYLALSGARLKGKENVVAGVATHFVPRASLPPLRQALADVCTGSAEEVRAVVQAHSQDVAAADSEIRSRMPVIDRCFSESSVEAIIAALRSEGDVWADALATSLLKMSPTSMKITFQQLRRSERLGLSLQECLDMELHMASRCMEEPDFYEGVRCMLVDKGSKPSWMPASLEDTAPAYVDSFFSLRFKSAL